MNSLIGIPRQGKESISRCHIFRALPSRPFAIALLCLGALLFSRPAEAQTTYNYTPNDTTGSGPDSWTAGTDWDNAPASSIDTTLSINLSGTNAVPLGNVNVNDLVAQPFQLNQLILGGAGSTTPGATVSITIQGGVLNFVNSTLAVAPVLTLSAANNAGVTYNVNSNILLGNNLAINGGGNATFIISGNISDGGSGLGLTMGATGTLQLSGVNTYTGATLLNSGTLNLGSSTALGAGIITFGGGTLQYSGANQVDYSAQIFNSTGAISVDLNGQTVTYATALDSSNTGGLSVQATGGLGQLILSAANGYSGNTTLSSGTLVSANAGALGSTANPLLLNGGLLDLQATSAYNTTVGGNVTIASDNLTSGAGGVQTLGTLSIGNQTLTIVSGGNVSSGSGTIAFGAVTLTGGSGVNTVFNPTTGVLTLASVGSGNNSNVTFGGSNLGGNTVGAITIGSGTVTVAGSVWMFDGANTYTGSTIIGSGTLILGTGGSLSASTGLALTGASSVFQLGDSSNAINQTVAGITGVAGSELVGGNSSVSTLTVNNIANYTYLGAIGGGGANQNNIGITESGAASLTFGGANTYVGATNLTAGTLVLSNTGAVQDSALTLTGGTLALRNDTNNALFVDASTTINGNVGIDVDQASAGSPGNTLALGNVGMGANIVTLTNNAGATSYNLALGTVTASAGPTFTNNMVNGVATLTALVSSAATPQTAFFNGSSSTGTTSVGAISQGAGALAVTQNGSETLVLTGVNSYTGATTLTSGVLTITGQLGNSAVTATGGTLNLNGASAISQNTLLLNGTGIVSVTENTANALAGTAALNVDNPNATVTLSQANSYTGATAVNLGTLTITGALGNSAVTVAGGTLNLNGTGALNQNLLVVNSGTVTESALNAISGTVGVTINGGLVTLSQGNSFTGTTKITSGTLTITGSLGNTPVVAVGGVLNLNGGSAINQNTLTGTGGTITEGATNGLAGTAGLSIYSGNVTLSQANSFNGATSMNGGNLVLSNVNAIQNSALSLNNGGSVLKLRSDVSSGSFTDASTTITSNVTIDADQLSAGTLHNTLHLGNIGIANNTLTVTNNAGATDYNLAVGTVTASAGPTFTNNMVSGTLTIGALTSTAATAQGATFNGTSPTAVTSVGAITQNGANALSVTQSGSDTLLLTGVNTYTGNTTVQSGGLTVTGALGNSAVNVSAGGTFNLDAASAMTQNTLTVQGVVTENTTDALAGTTGLTVNANTALVTLSSSNNNTGATSLQTGTLVLGAAGAISSGTITVSGTGTLTENVTNAISGNAGLTLSNAADNVTLTQANNYTGTTSLSTGTLNLGVAGAISSGSVVVTGTGTLTEGAANAIGGNAGLVVNAGNANIVLSVANNYSSATILSSGTLTLSAAGAIGSSALTLGGGTLRLRNDTNNTTFADTSTTINGSVTIDVDKASAGSSGNTLKLGAIGMANNTVTFTNNAGATDYNLALGTVTASAGPTFTNNMVSGTAYLSSLVSSAATGATAAFNGTSTTGTTSVGAISQGAGALAVSQNGVETLILTGVNTYTGATSIASGVMTITGQLGNTSVAVNGGTLNLNGASAINQNTVTVSGGTMAENTNNALGGSAALVINNAASDVLLSSSNNYTGATTLQTGTLVLGAGGAISSGTISVTGASTLTENATNGISGNAGLTINTVADNITLAQANNYTGTTSLTTGTLNLGAAGAISSGSIVVTGTGTINENVTNAIGGNAGLVVNTGAANIVLTQANTYTGPTILTTGTLALANINAIQNSALTISGGTLRLRSDTTSGSFTDVSTTINASITIDADKLSAGALHNTLLMGNISMGGNTLTFTNNAGATDYNLTTGTITASAAPTLTNNLASGTLTIGGIVTPAGVSGVTLNGASGGVAVISGSINSGTGTISVNAAGTTWILSGASTVSGTATSGTNTSGAAISITSGTVLVGASSTGPANSPTSGPLGTGELYFAGGGGIGAYGGPQTIANIVGYGNPGMNVVGTQNITFTGLVSAQGSSTITVTNTGTTTFAGGIDTVKTAARSVTFAGTGYTIVSGSVFDSGGNANGSLLYAGTGTLDMSGSNQYSGATSFESGVSMLDGSSSSTASMAGTAITVGNTAANATMLVKGNYTIGNSGAPSVTLTGSSATKGVATLSLLDGGVNVLTINNSTSAATDFTAGVGSQVYLEIGQGGADKIVLGNNGKASFSSTGTFNIVGIGGLTGGVQTIFSGSVGTTPPAISFTTGNYSGYTLTSATSANAITVTETANAAQTTLYWSGTQANAIWSTFTGGNSDYSNWATNALATTNATVSPGSTTNVYFNSAAGSNTSTTLGGSYSIASLNFNAAPNPVSISGSVTGSGSNNSLTIGSGGINVTSAVTNSAVTISAPVILGASQTWAINNATSAPFTVSGTVSGTNSNFSLTTSGTGTLILSGPLVSFSGGLSAGGGNLLELNASNTFTGGLTIGGSANVQLGNTGALNSNAVTFAASSTGTLSLNGNNVTIGGLSSNATLGAPVIQNANATTTGTLTLSQTGSSTYGGVLQDGGVSGANLGLVLSTGTLSLTGANTYSGSTIVNGGDLNILGSLGANSSVLVNGGILSGTGTGSGAVINGAVTIGHGGELMPGTATAPGTLHLAGGLTVSGTSGGSAGIAAFNIINATSNDLITVTGNLNFGNGAIIEVNSVGVTTSGTYELATYSGTTNLTWSPSGTFTTSGTLNNITEENLTGGSLPSNFSFVVGSGSLELIVASTTQAIPSINISVPSANARVMSGTTISLSGTIFNTGTANALSGTLSNPGGLSVTNLTAAPITVAAGSSATYSGSLATGSVLGTGTFGVKVLDGNASPTSATATGTVDVLQNRSITSSAVAFGLIHAGANSLTTTLSSPGVDTQNTRLTVANSGTSDANGVSVTGADSGDLFNGGAAGGVSSDLRTVGGTIAVGGAISGTFYLSTSGENLTGESDQPVQVTYTATTFSGQATWSSSAGNSSWATNNNWGDTNSHDLNGIGAPGVSGALSVGDTATFGDFPTGETSTTTVNLNGANPTLAGLTFDAASTTYTLAQGSGGTLTLQGGATVTLSAGEVATISAPLSATGFTYNGNTTGLLQFTGAISAGANTITVSSGTLQIGNGGTAGSINSSATVSVSAGAAYSIDISGASTFAGGVSGSGTFIDNGPGNHLILTGNQNINNYVVNAGALDMQTHPFGNSPTATGTITINAGAELLVNESDMIGGASSATPNVTVNINGGQWYQNANIVNIGTLNMSSGTIYTNAGYSPAYPSISIRGPVITVNGSGESYILTTNPTNTNLDIKLSGTNTQSLNINTFNVASTGAVSGVDLSVSANLADGFNPGGQADINSEFIKTGAGTMLLSGSNVWGGGTHINGGVLELGSAYALPLQSVATADQAAAISTGTVGAISFGGGTLEYTSSNTVDYSGSFANSTSAISIDVNGQTVTFASALASSNTGGLTLKATGGGELILSAANAYTGVTTINSGTLNLNNASALGGGGNITFGGGLLQYTANNNVDYSSKIVSSGSAIKIDLNGRNVNFGSALASTNTGGLTLLATTTGTLTLGGANAYTGSTAINGGVLALNNASALGGGGNISFGGGTLQYSTNNQGDYSSNIVSSASAINIDLNGQAVVYNNALASTNTAGLSLNDSLGGGELTLKGANAYTGATSVNGGQLNVLGSLGASSNVTVNSGGILSGTGGTVNGTVTINSGGKLTAGTATGPGTLNLANGLTISSGGILALNVLTNGSANDTINVTGNANLSSGAILEVTNGIAISGTYALVNFSASTNVTWSPSGTFTTSGTLNGITEESLTGGALNNNYSFVVSGNSIDLVIAPTPQAIPNIALTTPTNGTRVMELTSVTISGSVTNSGTVNALNGTLTDGGQTLTVSNLSPSPITVANQSSTTFTGTIGSTGSTPGSQTYAVTVTDSNAQPTSASITGTLDVLQNRVITTTVTPGFGSIHAGTVVSGTTGLLSTGADNLNTRVSIINSSGTAGTDSNGISVTLSNPTQVFNGTGSGTSETVTLSGTLSTLGSAGGTITVSSTSAETGGALPGEMDGTVGVHYTAQVFSGHATWSGGAANGSWSSNTNWGDTNSSDLNGAGAPGLAGSLSIGDTATITDGAGETVGGVTTINLNGATPSLAGLTFDSTNSVYNIAVGTGSGVITLQSGATMAVTTGTGELAASTFTSANPLTVTVAAGSDLIWSGSEAFTGSANITSGTLTLVNPSWLAHNAGIYNINSGATLEWDNTAINLDSTTHSTTVEGSGTLLVDGGGKIEFSAANLAISMASGGVIEVSNGFLLNGGAGAGSVVWTSNLGSMYLASGGTFDPWDNTTNVAPVNIDALYGSGVLTRGGYGNGGAWITLGDNNGSGTFNGLITNQFGTLNLTKEGTGLEVFTGSNSYTGSTGVTGGTLRITNNAGLGYGGPTFVATGGQHTAAVTGGTLDLSGGVDVDKAISLNGGASLINGSAGSNSILDSGIAGVTFTTDPAAVGTYTVTFSGGSGAGATATAGYINSTGSTAGQLYDSGANYAVYVQMTGSGSGYTTGAGAPTVTISNGSGNVGGTVTAVVSSVTLGGTGNTIGGNGNLTLNAQITGTGGFSTVGTGTLTLNNANTYTGTTTIDNDTVVLGNVTALGAATNALAFGAAASGTLEINGYSITVGGLSTNSGTTGTPTITGAALLTVNQSGTTTYGGVLVDGGSALSLTNAGTGKLILTGINTFSGSTTISAGTLQLGNGTSGNDGTIADSLNIYDNGALIYDRFGSATYSGSITGTGSLTMEGSGTQTLSGSNNYSGTTTLAGGQLALGSVNALAGTGNLKFTGGSLQYSASNQADVSARIVNSTSAIAVDVNGQNVTYGSSLAASNTAGLTLNDTAGGGTLNLNHSNAYTGNTTVNAGTLNANAAGALGGSANVAVNGGTLLLNASNAGSTTNNVNLNGGTLALNSTAAVTESMGSLTLSSNSTLDFGSPTTGSSILFSQVNAGFTGMLTVNNWSATDSLLFTSNTNNLATFAASDVQFNIGGVDWAGGVQQLAPNEYELVAVPEPGTYAAGLALVAFVCWKERRRIKALLVRFKKAGVA